SGHEVLLSTPRVTPNTLEQKVADKKPLMNSDPIQRQRPVRREHPCLPQGFFDGAPDNVHTDLGSLSPPAPTTALLCHPHRHHARINSSAAFPHSSIVMPSKLLQCGTDKHCMLLRDRNQLVIR
ncbi:hypothetical protein K503DRAFT_787614, partial [Rhizopogon vinicolor AM-OR11-026]